MSVSVCLSARISLEQDVALLCMEPHGRVALQPLAALQCCQYCGVVDDVVLAYIDVNGRTD